MATIIDFIDIEHLNLIFLIGVILFGGTFTGRIFQKFRIPQVVGYICLGVILGRTGFGFINEKTIEALKPFSFFALGLIGFMIGGELKLSSLKKYGRQFSLILILEAMGAFIIVSALMIFTGSVLFQDWNLAIAFGLLMGAIASATAPAATTDVLWENKTKGPLTTMVLGIVAMDDAFALLLFAMASSIAGVLIGSGGTSITASLMRLAWEIGMAVALGIAGGSIMKQVVRSYIDDDKILAFSIGAILLLIGAAQLLDVDMILTTMTLGFFVSNNIPLKSKRTFDVVEKFTPPVYILFFVLVGANLNIKGLTVVTAVLALLYIIGRTGGKAIGAIVGSIISKAPTTVKRYLPFCLLSQAGVAIGLSIVAGQNFKGPVGDTIVLVVTATTFVVQLGGPNFVKYAAMKSGEAGLNITEDDLIRQSTAAQLADTDIPFIQENESLPGILEIFSQRENLYYPVVKKDGGLTGMLSIEKLKDSFGAADFSNFLLAHDIMDRVNYRCTAGDSAADIYSYLKKSHQPAVPMVDDAGKAIGILEFRRIQYHISQKLAEYDKKSRQMEEA